jgi:hypothetical protein
MHRLSALRVDWGWLKQEWLTVDLLSILSQLVAAYFDSAQLIVVSTSIITNFPASLREWGAIVDLLTLNDYGSASACSLRHGVCFRILDASLFLIVQPLINIGN